MYTWIKKWRRKRKTKNTRLSHQEQRKQALELSEQQQEEKGSGSTAIDGYGKISSDVSEYRKLMTLHNIQQLLQPHLPTVTIGGESFAMDTKDLDSFDGGSKNSPIHSQILSEGSISFFLLKHLLATRYQH